MKSISNFIKSASENAKRFAFLVGATAILVTTSSLCSCSGNSKGNAGNEDKSTDAVEQQAAEPEKSEKEIALENIRKTFSRFSYSIFLREGDDDLKVYVDKDGYMIVKHISKSYSGTQTYFTLFDSRYLFVDGQQITYNPKMTADDISPFVMQEVLFILTKYSLQGDPTIRSRKDIDISQYLYYLVFGNDDADDFVKERVQMHYDVAMEQLLDEANYIQEYKTNSASSFTFRYEPSSYNQVYKINIHFDNNGKMVVSSGIWQ